MATIRNRAGVVIHSGALATVELEVMACIVGGISLAEADLRGVNLAGRNLAGLFAPGCDLTGANLSNITANGPGVLELSAAELVDIDWRGATLNVAKLDCTAPNRFAGVTVGPQCRLAGVNWSRCPDVIVLPVRDDRALGKVVAMRNGGTWRVHAGARAVGAEATAKAALEALPGADGQKYREAFAWLEGPEGQSKKAEVAANRDRATAEIAGAKMGGNR